MSKIVFPNSAFSGNKYKAKKVHTGRGSFDSAQEHKHFTELELMERAGEITDLSRQKQVKLYCNGKHITSYRADATYSDVKTGHSVLWESKGFETATWRIKRKLIIAQLNELGFDEFHIWYKDKRELHR